MSMAMVVLAALFTVGTAATSLIGGDLMGLDIRYPFFVCIGAAVLAIAFVVTIWRFAGSCRLAGRGSADGS